MEEAKNRTDIQTLKRVYGLVAPFKGLFRVSFLLGIFVAFVSIVRPVMVQRIIDNDILNYNMKALQQSTILFFIILIVEFASRYLFSHFSGVLGQRIIRDLRVKVFKHVESLKIRYFDKTPIGIITTRTINDVEAVSNVFTDGFITLFTDILTLIIVIVTMLIINWKLALVSMATFPLIWWATYIFKEAVKASYYEVREKVAAMNAYVQEHIVGMRMIQAFSAERREYNKFDHINKEHLDANLKSVWAFSIFFPVVEVILSMALALMLWYSCLQIMRNDVINFVGETATVGMILQYNMLLNMAFRPLRMLADKLNTLQMGVVAADRVFKLLDTHDHIEDKGTIYPAQVQGAIRFERVWFAYNQEDWVLKDISFEVKPKQTIAIVGATGSGKTSTIQLLNRFYEYQSGQIYLDEQPLEAYSLEALRKIYGTVLQDFFLFSGSIFENISLGDSSITKTQIIEAAKLVGAHDFIMELPGDYDYPVMERGSTLSVGQRQLISFIRVLVFNPDILVMDEATSSVDTASEILIQQAIDKVIQGRTSIIIAHRLSTIQHADKIIVLDRGAIVEQGTHKELLEIEDGYYAKLYHLQFKDSEVA
jgi:ATP-binding cassette subfamily B protein